MGVKRSAKVKDVSQIVTFGHGDAVAQVVNPLPAPRWGGVASKRNNLG
jgi:hypothetical protein